MGGGAGFQTNQRVFQIRVLYQLKYRELWQRFQDSVSRSKRAVGISGLKTKIARAVGIPTTKQGLERKIGGAILKGITGKRKI